MEYLGIKSLVRELLKGIHLVFLEFKIKWFFLAPLNHGADVGEWTFVGVAQDGIFHEIVGGQLSSVPFLDPSEKSFQSW